MTMGGVTVLHRLAGSSILSASLEPTFTSSQKIRHTPLLKQEGCP